MYRIETEALVKKVHNELWKMIVSGELQPGQKLIQDDLAIKLGVSRTPLLTAFSGLEQENLVITIPRRGVYVKQYTDRELIDLGRIFMSLESLSVHEAALTATRDLTALKSIQDEFDRAANKKNEILLKQKDCDFHMEIIRIGGNNFLYNMLLSIIAILNMNGLLMGNPEKCTAEHHEIMEAIVAGDPEKAKSLIYNHSDQLIRFINEQKAGDK